MRHFGSSYGVSLVSAGRSENRRFPIEIASFDCYTLLMREQMIQPVSMPDELTPYQRFERLAKCLFDEPKGEIQQKMKENARKKARTKKRKAATQGTDR